MHCLILPPSTLTLISPQSSETGSPETRDCYAGPRPSGVFSHGRQPSGTPYADSMPLSHVASHPAAITYCCIGCARRLKLASQVAESSRKREPILVRDERTST
ncbi:uncharacterized protein SETTUDRAFT_162402 [Exserohilum turcica Et28A]|uniref:Uncharacterized protein n=1 Tax=Exserohilum turcicum (strain 28A) TaxID=671987 RepID=R0KS70_EXST2|nr:uncharacterized protein SETTUDRAFT_162402 [Exserohilum turcica Et28A]EOA91834.1 hypothetical protein SETTUDRAFT_162402 [Exserohilum turcica Et28A]